MPYDLLKPNLDNQTGIPPLSRSWTVEVGAGEMRFFGGFSLGVFAPRPGTGGKVSDCTPDDRFSKPVASKTLQGCFLACANEPVRPHFAFLCG